MTSLTHRREEMKPTISAENLIWMLSQDPTDNLENMIGENK